MLAWLIEMEVGLCWAVKKASVKERKNKTYVKGLWKKERKTEKNTVELFIYVSCIDLSKDGARSAISVARGRDGEEKQSWYNCMCLHVTSRKRHLTYCYPCIWIWRRARWCKPHARTHLRQLDPRSEEGRQLGLLLFLCCFPKLSPLMKRNGLISLARSEGTIMPTEIVLQ